MTHFAIGPDDEQDRVLLVWGGDPIPNPDEFRYAHTGLPKRLDRRAYLLLQSHRYRTMYHHVATVRASERDRFLRWFAEETGFTVRPMHEAAPTLQRWIDHPAALEVDA